MKVEEFKYSEFKSKLLDRGFEVIGAGFYSVVYGRERSDRVIKVARMDGTYHFLRLAQEHPDNPHYPRVYFLKKIGGGYVAVLERLTCWDRDEDRMLRDMQEQARDFLDTKRPVSSKRILERKYPPMFLKALELIKKTVGYDHGHSDLHAGNVMVRQSDGCLVITDPYAS